MQAWEGHTRLIAFIPFEVVFIAFWGPRGRGGVGALAALPLSSHRLQEPQELGTHTTFGVYISSFPAEAREIQWIFHDFSSFPQELMRVQCIRFSRSVNL